MRAATRLNSPENRKAFGRGLAQSLRGQMQQFQQDAAVRRILMTAAGAAFWSGADFEACPTDRRALVGGGEHYIETMRYRGCMLARDRDRPLSRHCDIERASIKQPLFSFYLIAGDQSVNSSPFIPPSLRQSSSKQLKALIPGV